MTKKDGVLGSAYDASTLADVGKLYGTWAATYDEELIANGYASPRRTAAAMADHVADPTAPLLDIGCGTGLSGAALRDAGFSTIDGTDMSPEMLALAGHKGIYRNLVPSTLEDPLPAAPGSYADMTAIGVFSPGHAPAALITDVLALLAPGGCFGFSLNDHALEDPSYRQTIDRVVAAGAAAIAFEDYGDHLPGIGLKSQVVVLKKASAVG